MAETEFDAVLAELRFLACPAARHGVDVGRYWNACEDAADAIEALRARCEELSTHLADEQTVNTLRVHVAALVRYGTALTSALGDPRRRYYGDALANFGRILNSPPVAALVAEDQARREVEEAARTFAEQAEWWASIKDTLSTEQLLVEAESAAASELEVLRRLGNALSRLDALRAGRKG